MVAVSKLREAEQLLQKIESWTESEIEELPRLYREKAREYRQVKE
jgi:hypothetical protein